MARLYWPFTGWEILYHRRGKTPLLSAAFATSKGYALGTMVALCQFGVGAGMAAVTSFYFLSGTGMAPLATAAILAPQAAGMLLASSFSWRYLARCKRAGIVFALLASLATMVAKDVFVQHFDSATAALAVAVVGLGHPRPLRCFPVIIACLPLRITKYQRDGLFRCSRGDPKIIVWMWAAPGSHRNGKGRVVCHGQKSIRAQESGSKRGRQAAQDSLRRVAPA